MENVPYQAYKSKRHSRTASALPLVPSATPPSLSRPSSLISNGSFPQQLEYFETEKIPTEYPIAVSVATNKPAVTQLVPSNKELPSPPSTNGMAVVANSPQNTSPSSSTNSPTAESSSTDGVDQQPTTNGKSKEMELTSPVVSPSSAPAPLPSSLSSGSIPKKTSTFRRITPRTTTARPSLPSSPLRAAAQLPLHPTSSSDSNVDRPNVPWSPPLHSRVASISSVISEERLSPGIRHFASDSSSRRQLDAPRSMTPPVSSVIQSPHRVFAQLTPPPPPPKTTFPSPMGPSSTLAAPPVTSPQTSTSSLPKVTNRSPAPYRPGFQPKGVYRPRTDEFVLARKVKSDAGRIERTKLERRLEKLINLHFPVGEQRRASSFFEFDISVIKNVDATDIWKGDAKGDIRAAEQRITPWQEDSAVSKCPFCASSFHPLTNRKHHCRLCGQIICSLPIKRPQRPDPCSILFVVDSKTRKIEEVGEGVDYGVRKRSVDPKRKGKQKEDPLSEDEKFLKGVRLCKSCKPILAREQYRQDSRCTPVFIKLYEAFLSLEKEIEEWLPQFQELLMTLSNDNQPTKEASAARKRLLDSFAEYDALSKRIRKFPCPPGSPQDRVQLAILARANLFLQKNMFPLQFIPKPKKNGVLAPPITDSAPIVDPDSELAYALQPLLEQEALLESFVGEAMAHRKFEDAKTLKANLVEIRAEIDRMLSTGSDRR
ncbi:FYVE zinc finger-domain-containing protein [Scleroderma yunnanense]